MDEDDWIDLFRNSLPELYRFASRRVGGHRELAEDVVQEAWLRALRTWPRSGPPADPLAWLRTAAANLIANHFRRPLPRSHIELDEQPVEGASGREAERERVAAVHRGLACLRPGVAELLSARHLDGLSLETLAERHGSTVRAIEGRLRRGRQALSKHLAPHLLDPGS